MIMNTAILLELFGYLGSVLVVISMLMSSVVKLRIINVVGSVISGIYALICGTFPLFLMNVCLIVINVYNLYKLLKTKQEYDLVECKADDMLLAYFLEKYKEDIQMYFPKFPNEMGCNRAYVTHCKGTPVAVLLGNEKEKGVLDIVVDYSIPAYRDCSVGSYLYSKLEEKGIEILECSIERVNTHVIYLDKMGFVKRDNKYVKNMKYERG